MTASRTRIAAFWRQRTPREQLYLSVMLVALAVFAYWFALVVPLRTLAAAAEQRHVAAQARQARLPDMLAEIGQRQRPAATSLDAEGLQRSAEAAGVRVSVDAATTPGRWQLRFESTSPQALFTWLAQLRDGHAMVPLTASVRRAPAGVEGELVFPAPRP